MRRGGVIIGRDGSTRVSGGSSKTGKSTKIADVVLRCVLCGALTLLGAVFSPVPIQSHAYVRASSGTWHISKVNKASETGPEVIGAVAILDHPIRLAETEPDSDSFAIHGPFLAKQLPTLLRIYYLRPPPTA